MYQTYVDIPDIRGHTCIHQEHIPGHDETSERRGDVASVGEGQEHRAHQDLVREGVEETAKAAGLALEVPEW